MMGIEQSLRATGVECAVLNTSGVRSWMGFCLKLMRFSLRGWTFHVHTNGHNRNSWLIALACGLIAKKCVLTLHSGMAPAYITAQSLLPRLASRKYDRIIGVNSSIADALTTLGVPTSRIDVIPAYLGVARSNILAAAHILDWMASRNPVLSTALFFRPEYGFDLLMEALCRLRERYPRIGCVVMGSGDDRETGMRLINALGMEQNVLLAGDVDHDACLSAMARSTVFVRPTTQDGDSISVREALSLGVPVVASRVGTRPESAVLFQPGNLNELVARIEETLANPRKQPGSQPGSMGSLMKVYHAAA